MNHLDDTTFPKIVYMMTERNIGIDILKFLAVLLITNSHMKLLYGKYSFLATGGTLGDVLFFFCSGFTLFMKPITSIKDFPNWYKRRINRIYPTVLAIAIIKCSFCDSHEDINSILLSGGGWFVKCIMIYYVVIYFIGLYAKDKINWIIGFVSLASIAWFFSVERSFPFNMYGVEGRYMKWLLYFSFMLLGAKLGSSNIILKTKTRRSLVYALLGIMGFYVFYFIGVKVERFEYIEIFNFLPLLFAVYYIYQCGNTPMAKSLCQNKIGYFIIRFVGGLCLEMYLIQRSIFTDKLNHLFPLNIPIIFCIIVIAAYLSRCLARFISQTFKDNPYDWGKMISIY
jgi:cytochrome c oxidase subunit IV